MKVMRPNVKKDLPVTEISKELGKMWRELSDSEKEEWKEKAQKAQNEQNEKQ